MSTEQAQRNSDIQRWINTLRERPVPERVIREHVLCYFDAHNKYSVLSGKLWKTIIEHQKVSCCFLFECIQSAFIHRLYIPWRYLSENVQMSEDFILKYLDFLDWTSLAKFKKLSMFVINQMCKIDAPRVPWRTLVRYQDLEEEFLENHSHLLQWSLIYRYQKKSPSFMDRHAHKLNWLLLLLNNDFPREIAMRYAFKSNHMVVGCDIMRNVCSHPDVTFKGIYSPLTNAEFSKNLPHMIKSSHTLNQLYDTSGSVASNSFWHVRRSKVEWRARCSVPVPPIDLNIFHDKKETNCKEVLALSIATQAATPKEKYDTILFNAIKMEPEVSNNKVKQIVRRTKRTMIKVANSISFGTPHLVYAQHERVLAVGVCLDSDSEWLRSTASAYILILALQQPMQGITLRNVPYCTFDDFLNDICIKGWRQSGYTWKDVQKLMKKKLDVKMENEQKQAPLSQLGYTGIITACYQAKFHFPKAWYEDE